MKTLRSIWYFMRGIKKRDCAARLRNAVMVLAA
jgi:hypothetical protein